MPEIDFTGLPLQATIATLLFFAAIDTASAYLIALANKTFDAAYALDFLTSHILKIAVPITLTAIIGRGVPEAGIPAVPFAAVFATGSLAVYALTTIASIRASFADKAVVPKDED